MKTVYFNGKVYTGGAELSDAFVVDGDRFAFAGDNEEALMEAGDGALKVDLKGGFVSPGFNDSHMHLLNYGYALMVASLGDHTGSLEDVKEALRSFLIEHPKKEGEWLIGRGWNHDYFSDVRRMPDRFDLDEVSTDVPIIAVRACGHCMAVNSKALELAGVTADTPDPYGGKIGRNNGEPDGRFYDNAMPAVYAKVPAPDKEALKNMMRAAFAALNSFGVTSSQTDDYEVFPEVSWREINEAYRELEAEGGMTVRVYEQSNFNTLKGLKEFIEAGNVTGAGSDYFKIGPLKMIGDGSLGARTAYLSRSYADDPSTRGLAVFSRETMDEMISYANAHNMQTAVHAIGDGALDMVLNAVEKALKENPRKDHRHGVVHCQITRAEQLKKLAELNMHVYAQSIFLDYDSHIVRARVGEDLADTSYSWKTLMDMGVSVSNGSDCPVELPDVCAGMQCAVTRQTLRKDIPAYLPGQAFTVREALESYTVRGAEASFEENIKGSIAPGMLADFVILSQNPFEAEPDRIRDIRALATFTGGRKVYGELPPGAV